MVKPQQKTLVILAFFAIYVIWGSTYLLNKIAVADLPPFMLASIRFTVAGLLIFILARLLKIPLKISKLELRNTALAGFFFLAFGNGVVVWALKYVDSGFAALEISAQPLVILLMMFILYGKKISAKSMVGVFLGIIGIYLLVSQKELIADKESIIGVLMIFACMLSWAYGSLFVAKAQLPKNYFVNTGYQMFTGGLMLLIASLLFGEEWKAPQLWELETQVSMVLLIVFGSILAFTSFNYLLKIVSPEKVALFLGWFFLDEVITLQSIIAAIVLLTGVYFINSNKNKALLHNTKK